MDFHSWRRAFVQALADAEVNAQTAMVLAGHSSMGAHQRYLANAGKAREVPEAALPTLEVRALVSSRDSRGASDLEASGVES